MDCKETTKAFLNTNIVSRLNYLEASLDIVSKLRCINDRFVNNLGPLTGQCRHPSEKYVALSAAIFSMKSETFINSASLLQSHDKFDHHSKTKRWSAFTLMVSTSSFAASCCVQCRIRESLRSIWNEVYRQVPALLRKIKNCRRNQQNTCENQKFKGSDLQRLIR